MGKDRDINLQTYIVPVRGHYTDIQTGIRGNSKNEVLKRLQALVLKQAEHQKQLLKAAPGILDQSQKHTLALELLQQGEKQMTERVNNSIQAKNSLIESTISAQERARQEDINAIIELTEKAPVKTVTKRISHKRSLLDILFGKNKPETLIESTSSQLPQSVNLPGYKIHAKPDRITNSNSYSDGDATAQVRIEDKSVHIIASSRGGNITSESEIGNRGVISKVKVSQGGQAFASYQSSETGDVKVEKGNYSIEW